MTACTLIEAGIGEWRSAVIDEDGLPVALDFHAEAALTPLHAIFDARVTKLDTASDIAFLDLDGKRSGILNLRRAKLIVGGSAQSIGDCVAEGERLRVQVVAEPSLLDDKALPVTPRPRLTGRYVVAEAGASRLNFSKDLGPKAVKELTELLSPIADQVALVVRSRASSVTPEAVADEARWLAEALTAPQSEGLVFSLAPIEQALLAVEDGDSPVLVTDIDALHAAQGLARNRWPDLFRRVALYEGDHPAFEALGVEEAIDEALADRIELPSGGWIGIHPTPAMTAIDVNMGAALQGRRAVDAKLQVNLEAVQAIAFHLRFQDIGGLVVVDFIDMGAKGHAAELMAAMDDAFRADSVPIQHTGISTFGLVEIARKRTGLSLRDRLTVARKPAMRAQGAALKLLREARRAGMGNTPGQIEIRAEAAVTGWLEARPALTEALSAATARQVKLTTATPGGVAIVKE
ncbi:ribonuclease E/G [Pseudokordiimonas caeni]|uniref:ribonuclease E/G n=1 Tax=Pseudokordiimonas caeni TaxID=2997908 RepID=UPI002812818F|nr:ribonuclease E/G [Pseudokordiimonas caeni]